MIEKFNCFILGIAVGAGIGLYVGLSIIDPRPKTTPSHARLTNQPAELKATSQVSLATTKEPLTITTSNAFPVSQDSPFRVAPVNDSLYSNVIYGVFMEGAKAGLKEGIDTYNAKQSVGQALSNINSTCQEIIRKGYAK